MLEELPRVGGRQGQGRTGAQEIASWLSLEGCECGDSVPEMVGPREKPQIRLQERDRNAKSHRKSSCAKAERQERAQGLLKALVALAGLGSQVYEPV